MIYIICELQKVIKYRRITLNTQTTLDVRHFSLIKMSEASGSDFLGFRPETTNGRARTESQYYHEYEIERTKRRTSTLGLRYKR